MSAQRIEYLYENDIHIGVVAQATFQSGRIKIPGLQQNTVHNLISKIYAKRDELFEHEMADIVRRNEQLVDVDYIYYDSYSSIQHFNRAQEELQEATARLEGRFTSEGRLMPAVTNLHPSLKEEMRLLIQKQNAMILEAQKAVNTLCVAIGLITNGYHLNGVLAPHLFDEPFISQLKKNTEEPPESLMESNMDTFKIIKMRYTESLL